MLTPFFLLRNFIYGLPSFWIIYVGIIKTITSLFFLFNLKHDWLVNGLLP